VQIHCKSPKTIRYWNCRQKNYYYCGSMIKQESLSFINDSHCMQAKTADEFYSMIFVIDIIFDAI